MRFVLGNECEKCILEKLTVNDEKANYLQVNIWDKSIFSRKKRGFLTAGGPPRPTAGRRWDLLPNGVTPMGPPRSFVFPDGKAKRTDFPAERAVFGMRVCDQVRVFEVQLATLVQ